MRILTGFFFVSLEALLLDFGSGSKCQPLNATLFKNCEQAGFHNSSALDSSIQDMSSLISNMQRKFNCSSLSDLMTCSLHIPKCPSTKLPCKDTCKKFLTDIENTSIESDGLKALFRGLCEVLPLTNCKTSKSHHFNDTHTDNSNVTCHKLVLKQCQKFGYTYTSVTRDYQKVVNSSTIFQQVDGNSTKLRKVVCMEIAPPCATNKTSTQLQVPCKSLCDDAFKESRSQFAKVFKDQEYCLAFPNATKRGQELCQLQQWPDNVYWPSGLWMSLEMTAQQKKKSTGPTVPASLSTTEATNLTTHQTTRILNALKPSTYTSTSSPITDTTTPNSTSSLSVTVTKPTLTIGVTTPVTSNYKSMPSAATTETPKPSLSSKATTPTTTINKTNSTSPSTKAAKPSSSTMVTAPSTSSNKTSLPAPSPSTKVTTPASPSNKPSSHVSSTEGTTLAPSTKEKMSAPATKVTTPASPSNKPSSHVSSTEGTTPPPSTKEKTSAPTTKVPTPSPGATPTSSTKGTKKGQPPKVSATKGAKMSGGTIAGIVVGVIVLIIAIAAGVVCFRRFHRIKIQYRHSLMVDMDEL